MIKELEERLEFVNRIIEKLTTSVELDYNNEVVGMTATKVDLENYVNERKELEKQIKRIKST